MPFEHLTSVAAITKAVYVEKERPPKLPALSPTGVSYGALWYVAEACWAEKPEERPAMKDVLMWFS